MGAVDIASWDLKGKLLKQPVYNLLVGKVRHRQSAAVLCLGASLLDRRPLHFWSALYNFHITEGDPEQHDGAVGTCRFL